MSVQSQLAQFGLRPNEAKVYIAGLKIGPAAVQAIANAAKLNRVTVYGLIDTLIAKGFIEQRTVKNKRVFAAVPPMKLYDLLGKEMQRVEKKRDTLEELVPKLKNLASTVTSATNTIYYEGEEGLKNWASAALETEGELLEWTKIESFSQPFKEYLDTYYFPEKCRRQIPTRFIFLDTPAARNYVQHRYVKDPQAPPMKARFISQEKFDSPGFMVVFNNRFSIAVPKELRAVTVEDALIADAQRKIWEFGWLHATDQVSNTTNYPKMS